MKQIIVLLLLSKVLVAQEHKSIVIQNNYSADKITYKVSSNNHGMVLSQKNEKIYLGKSCDVFSKEEGKGHWGYYKNGTVWLKFENELSFSIKDKLPQKYSCPTKDIKISYDEVYAECVGEGAINNSLIHICAGTINHLMEKKIQNMYESLLKTYKEESPESFDKLKESQKMWQSYKEAQCNLEGWAIGTPMYDLCPVRINEERIKNLKGLRE